ncbi:MAG: DEAD/DEAH box helicase family protein [Betaproteobacteria bacterium]|nr:DEAD/DEAH box helicase family protein [Betaproteobacteria bacterium]
MFALKSYQVAALEALEGFFGRVRSVGLAAAWTEKVGYDATALGEVPAVCVRIPTGGGKTLLAAHAVGRIGKPLCGNDAPVVLWLVPSDAIRAQTLAALQSPRHPCREALAGQFGDALRVCAIDELATVNPHESNAIVVVATIQTFNVRDRTIRNVYAVDESLAPHFQALTPQQTQRLDCITAADLAAQPYLTAADLGKVKSSLANWLVLHRPLVIVDEAHNNRTEQAFRTLRNLHPLGLIELTATPTGGSNVLWHVGAQALQREEMIKLPIVLMEHPTGWKDAVRDAILTRDRLETLALKEPDYIRPVLLFQAEAKNGEATVEALLAHLISADGEKLDRRQIAVATGEQKELDGIVLADPTCPIRYVITVEALKEGWDCPFAYVLCSLQDAKSAKDVEQLLGRVLRMPYARSRVTPELNKAYAHIVAQGFARVADQLTDRLVNNMGFEAYEAALAIQQAPLPLPDGQAAAPRPIEAAIPLPAVPAQAVPASLASALEIRPTANGATALVRGEISPEVEDFLLTACTPRQQPALREAIERERLRQAAQLAPSARGVRFAPLPQLCFLWEGELQPVERRVLAELGDFDLFAEALNLSGFALTENGPVFEIELDGGRVHYHVAEPEQLYLDQVPAHASENDLVRWLDRECRQPEVAQAAMLKWLLALLRHLLADRCFTLTALVRAKYPLAAAIRAEIERRRGLAVRAGFQKSLPGLVAAPALADSFRYGFVFHPDRYPARPPFYSGRYRFQKHYYPVIHDLREKRADGTPAEEFICARAIDTHPAVRHWVRNVEREERFSFWLPTATDYFYPDFVCELNDGRVLVIEYKGAHLLNDETREKSQVGRQWEASSDGRCLFLLAMAEDRGRDVAQQIAAKISGT